MDDEEVVRRAAERVLTGMGCEVALAADGAEAIEKWTASRARGSPFDVVVVDLTVPGALGGVETLERLRSLDPAVKVVVSSGYSTSPVMADHLERGFAAAIPKPWNADEVRRVVAGLIGPLPDAPPGPGAPARPR
jgi:two-component system, cell cycle sensor histidine kinase and response regulator CckA